MLFWNICPIAALVLLAAAIWIAFRIKMGTLRVGAVLLLLFAATYAAYLPIFTSLYDTSASLLGNLINSLRVISLDADYLEFYDIILANVGSLALSRCYLILLGLFHFLLPVTSALAAYTILLRCFESMQLIFINGHRRPLFILSELNAESMLLAESIRRSVKRCDVVFASCIEAPRGGIRCSYQGESVSALKIKHSRARDIFFFCISSDENRNLNDALGILSACAALTTEKQKLTHIILFSSMNDTDIMLDSAEKGLVDIRIVNRYEEAAYALLNEHPLCDSAANRRISVLLIGLSKVNEAVFRAVSWCGQLEGYDLSVTVTGIDIEKELDALQASYPALIGGWHDTRLHSCAGLGELESYLRAECADATYIVVGGESDTESIGLAIRLRRLYYGIGGTFDNAPELFVYTEAPDKVEMIRGLRTSETKPERRVSYGIVPFGSTSEIYTYENLIHSNLDALSRNVHLVYTDIFSDTEIDVEKALAEYALFEVNKRSNRANAMHIRYKLAALGLDYTESDECDEADLAACLTPELLDRLTRAEHLRWMAFLESEGWVTASISEAEAYKASGISRGRHNCSIMKMHPYICPFDELQERSEKLGLPDSTVYDSELIRRIADILHDRWNVSGRRYRIIRK